MKDCDYYQLKEKKLKVNRMGTENYESADYDNLQSKLAFDKNPMNLMIDKEETYTHMKKGKLMFTKNQEARVEYCLSKFRVNKLGCMQEILQSKIFCLDGHHIENKPGQPGV